MATKKTTTAKKATPKTGPAAKKKPDKRTAAAKPTAAAKKGRRPGALDAAAKVLAEADGPMNSKEMIEAMAQAGYWTSPAGKTPAATLYSAILREINGKGKEARFQKVERGKFALKK